jgi:hypothetical protein
VPDPVLRRRAISKFVFAWYESRLERQKRAITHPELPVAIAIAVAPGEGPRLLK